MSKKRIKELDTLIGGHKVAIENCEKEKARLEEKNNLPKVTRRYLSKYFLKRDYFNKKETMLIHVREILSPYQYKGVKIQFHTNGSLELDINYQGHFASIGIEVGSQVWKDELLKVTCLVGTIPYSG